jgi:hypothetical protein
MVSRRVSQNGIHATNQAHRTNAAKSGVFSVLWGRMFPGKTIGEASGKQGAEAAKDFLSLSRRRDYGLLHERATAARFSTTAENAVLV